MSLSQGPGEPTSIKSQMRPSEPPILYQRVGGLLLSPSMQEVYRLIHRVSQYDFPVLITGETGTGKELVSRSIHTLGTRNRKPFVPVDCSTLVSGLIESELFGHTVGAFTGADRSNPGLFKIADNGTLFLDEIGELPILQQTRLLRALQEREIRPVGSTDRVSVNVRIIAATNLDLLVAIKKGTFRQDLYFRLNVVEIKLPALRTRKSDIAGLVEHFLAKFSNEREITLVSEDAMRCLMAYNWPGNVRELENVIERAVALGSGSRLDATDLPTNLQNSTETDTDLDELMPLAKLERRCILRALRQANGNKITAARILGMGKTTLYRKLREYGDITP